MAVAIVEKGEVVERLNKSQCIYMDCPPGQKKWPLEKLRFDFIDLY